MIASFPYEMTQQRLLEGSFYWIVFPIYSAMQVGYLHGPVCWTVNDMYPLRGIVLYCHIHSSSEHDVFLWSYHPANGSGILRLFQLCPKKQHVK